MTPATLKLKSGFCFRAITTTERNYIHGAAAYMGGYIATSVGAMMMMEQYLEDEDGYSLVDSTHYLALLPEGSKEGFTLDAEAILVQLEKARNFWLKTGYQEDADYLQMYIDVATGKSQPKTS